MDRTASPGLDHSDQLGLTRIGLKILRGTQTDLKIFRRYKKYDLPQTSSCIGLHFMQQQPGKMQDRTILHFVTLVVPCFPSFQYWFPISRCNSRSLHHGPRCCFKSHNTPSSILAATNFFLFSFLLFLFLSLFFLLHTCIYLIFYQKTHIFEKKKRKQLLGRW